MIDKNIFVSIINGLLSDNNTTAPPFIQNITNNSTNTTLNYFYTCNHTFSIKTTGYSDNAKLDSDLNYIIGNMKPDFKQAQD